MDPAEANSSGFINDIKHMFSVADKDKDGQVSFDEYIYYLDNVDEEIKKPEL